MPISERFRIADDLIDIRGRKSAAVFNKSVKFFVRGGLKMRDEGYGPAVALLREHDSSPFAVRSRSDDGPVIAIQVRGSTVKQTCRVGEGNVYTVLPRTVETHCFQPLRHSRPAPCGVYDEIGGN